MSRSFAQIHLAIWSDPDFRDLEPGPQRLYLFLISQPDLNYAGVVGLSPRRWVSRAKNYTLDQLNAELAVLIERRYVLVDEAEEELLVRTYIRNDGIFRNPKTMKSARRDALATGSRRLRQALIAELERLPLDDLPDKTREPITAETKDLIGSLAESIATPSRPHRQGVAMGSPGGSDGAVTGTGTGASVSVGEPSLVPNDSATPAAPPREKPDRAETPPREDVGKLCSTLSERLTANGFLKRDAAVGKDWPDEARRLLDLDKVDLDEALAVLNWCQCDSFWRTVIKSMSKFRAQYSTLRDKARTAGALRRHGSGSYYSSVRETTGAWDQ